MKAVKSSLALALTLALTTTAQANPLKSKELTLYGKANLSFQSSDENDEGSVTEVKSNASRVGVKGTYELESGFESVYQFEWQVNVDDDSKDSLTSRNQWVGLRHDNYGQLTIGRSDTAMKLSQGKFDLFNDYEGDIKNLFAGDLRAKDTLNYKSPKFNNVQVLATYIASENTEESDPYAIAVLVGDTGLKSTDYFFSVAIDKQDTGSEETRVTGMYKLGDFRIGGMWQESDFILADVTENGFAANVSYKYGNLLAKVQYQEFSDADVYSAGVDYKLGKKTKVYAWYTDRSEMTKFDEDASDFKFAPKAQYFAVGIEQKF